MWTLSSSAPWSRNTLALVSLILETASATRTNATPELHSPPRQCRRCKNLSVVFIRPAEVCASCWSGLLFLRWLGLNKKTNSSGLADHSSWPN